MINHPTAKQAASILSNSQKTIYMGLFDGIGRKYSDDKNDERYISGETSMHNGKSQFNAIPIFVGSPENKYTNGRISNTINHELGHSGGLFHVWNRESPRDARMDIMKTKQGINVTENLMNSEENPNYSDKPSTNGITPDSKKIVTDGQREEVIKTVEHEQK